jgi:hypothetical protein
MMPGPEALRDWTPMRFYMRESLPFVDWCYMADQRFTHPFFNDTIRQRMSQPFNLLFRHQTPIEFLGELSEKTDSIAPTGFIFHMSRCGSTLAAQMLASLSANIVISEAPPIDSIINSTDSRRGDWLRWMMAAFGRKRTGEEKNLFIKFDSWNTIELALIRRVFPDVPWIFLYRNPVEVIVSHMRQRGSQMVPGAMETILPGVSFSEALQMPPEEYCAKILARFCSAALKHADDRNALLVNYDQLPEAVTGVIASHFNLSFTPDELARMKEAGQFDAKTPQMFFEPDAARKRTDASDNARRAAASWLEPLYDQLEAKRLSISK